MRVVMRLVWHCWIFILVLFSVCQADVLCPGVTRGVCGEQCQLHVCKQLAAFYKATNNINPVNGPWDEEYGWDQTSRSSCTQLLAVSASTSQPVYCSWFGVTCCSPDDSADGVCSAVGAVAAIDLPLNNLNASISDASFMAPLLQLHACGLTTANLEQNCFNGSISDDWGKMVHLRVLSLANTWITGTIPDSIKNLRNLTKINLSNTWLSGSLPPWLGQLHSLESIGLGQTYLGGSFPDGVAQLGKLRELNLETTSLAGTLPADLCHYKGDSKLISLNIRGNGLVGSASMLENCHNLVQLDISFNNFTGQLPASRYWTQLTMYHANNNHFTGTFPRTLCLYAHILRDLDVSNNQVAGIIPARVGLMSSLESLNLANNQFTGPITENLFYFPGLRRLDLSNNQFVGTLPAYAMGFMFALLAGDFSNNTGITGIVPPQMGFAGNLKSMTLTGTTLSCADVIKPFAVSVNNSCNNPNVCKTPVWTNETHDEQYVCPEDQVLPCFLKFSDESLPRDDASNMRCRLIMRRPTEEARAACSAGQPPFFLGGEAANLPDSIKTVNEQAWVIDPSYYQYRGCSCLLGYAEMWSNNGTLLTCVEKPSMDNKTTAIIAAVSAVAGFAVLCALVMVGVLYLRTQPRWLRERIMQAKRVQGAPQACKPGDRVNVSVVVTDVKGFSALTRQYPDAMIKAMGGHNNIMRKACHMHAGYVLDQEGDSWTVAFHDADDAVAFSLQVQQALARKVWLLKMPVDLNKGKPGSDLLHSLDDLRREGLCKPTASMTSHRHPSLASSTLEKAAGSGATLPTLCATAAGSQTCHAAAAGAAAGTTAGPGSAAAAAAAATAAAAAPADAGYSQQHSSTLPEQLLLQPSGNSRTANSAPCFLRSSFTSSCGKGGACSSQSGTDNMAPRSEPGQASSASGPLNWLFKKPLSRSSRSSCSSGGHVQAAAQLSISSDTHPDLGGIGNAAAAQAGQHMQQQQQISDVEAGRQDVSGRLKPPALLASKQSGASFGSTVSYTLVDGSKAEGSSARRSTTDTPSTSRLQSVSGALLQRFANRGSKSSSLIGSLGSNNGVLQQQLKALRISVRIGIASGMLQYGSDLQNCAVTHRAKELVSDVANGGQVLLDEPTFLLVKDSLSLLGTVSEAGYDDRMLQRLMQAKVVGRLRQQAACAACASSRDSSFSSPLAEDEPQDYEHDAIVVHMGRFAAETPVPAGQVPSGRSPEDGDADQQQLPGRKGRHGIRRRSLRPHDKDSQGGKEGGGDNADAAAAVAAGAAERSESNLELLFVNGRERRANAGAQGAAGKKSVKLQQLHLYSIASPSMRRWPDNTQDLSSVLAWADPVNMKPGWLQLQKGFFQAPGARQMDLTPSAQLAGHSQAALPDVTIVFASVHESLSFTSKQSRATIHAVNKAIVSVMLQQLENMPGKDGYLCRCQEGDFKYMVAFEQPHHAVQWCLAVQEALLYEAWDPKVLLHPGFEEVICPDSGRPLFRGPRLRMGLAEGQPNSVLPDHSGRANYSGPSVIRAARFMDAAAHGGQVVTNLELVRKLVMGWVAQQREEQQQRQGGFSATAGASVDHSSTPGSNGQGCSSYWPQLDQLQQVQLPLAVRGAIPPIVEGQQLRDASQQDQQQRQLHRRRRHSDDGLDDCFRGGAADQAVAPRSLSWSAARPPTAQWPWRASGPGDRPESTADLAGSGMRQNSSSTAAAAAAMLQLQQQQQQGGAAAAAAEFPAAYGLDAVFALHLGQFRFKGCGEYEMVQLLHGALAARSFPGEPPRGKGERLGGQASDVVKDLPAVYLHVPAALLAARHAFGQPAKAEV